MRFTDMENGYRYAFTAAIQSYRRGSTPIGCAIVDANDRVLSVGQNSIFVSDFQEKVNQHHLAHAEINAILKIPSGKSDRSVTVYTTMEPCILCFGAMVMGYYNNLKFAAYDKFGGATCLQNATEFITEKNITVTGPVLPLQEMQIALITMRFLVLDFPYNKKYNTYCPEGVLLGEALFRDTDFMHMIDGNAAESGVLDYILQRCTCPN